MFYAQPYKSNWWGFIGKRVLVFVISLFIVTAAIFFTTQADFSNNVGRYWYQAQNGIIDFTPDGLNNLENYLIKIYHFDQPFIVQYFRFMDGVFKGDLPPSLNPSSYSK